MKFSSNVGNGVGRLYAGGAGMVVVKIPGEKFSIGRDGAFDFDDAGGTEIGPGEFFFAGPDDFDRTTGGAGKARGFDGGVAGVLATIGRAGVGHDGQNVALGNAQSVGEFAANAEGSLRASPDGEFIAGPFGDGGSGLRGGGVRVPAR